MRPRTITIILVLSMLALPVAAYGYQTVVLDEPMFGEDAEPTVTATQVRQRLQVHDPDNPIDEPVMRQQRLHATDDPMGNYDTAEHQRLQDRDQEGAMAGNTQQARQQQRLQVHDPDTALDEPVQRQQRSQLHTSGSGRGMLGHDEATCTGDCPND
ncbi:MAG: hypothetical protein HKN46_04970 [Acidimicrobiia bacterium]|nr:hypothetical protein [Acidimicrobiia bacterium]